MADHEIGNLPFQALIGRHADRVLDAALFQRFVDLRLREGRIGAKRHALTLRLLAFNLRNEQLVAEARDVRPGYRSMWNDVRFAWTPSTGASTSQ